MRSNAKVKRNNEIFNKHYHFGKTLGELAAEYKVSKSRIHQICAAVELQVFRNEKRV